MAQATTNVSDIQTVVTNVSGSTKYFGFLPYHGKQLADGASFTWNGDVLDALKTNKRKLTAFQNSINNGLIRVTRNIRKILYAKVYDTVAVSVGDLLFYDTSDDSLKPANMFTWTSDLATSQANFANVFMGRALGTHSASGVLQTNFAVDISDHSVYLYDCVSSTHELPQTMGVAQATGTNLLHSSKLTKAVASSSISIVASRNAAAATSVLVRLLSAYADANSAAQI